MFFLREFVTTTPVWGEFPRELNTVDVVLLPGFGQVKSVVDNESEK
jgi:hypothetical protein